MNLKTAALTAFVLIGLSQLAHGEDLGFRFDSETNQCVNAEGVEGLNPDFLGQCSDLSNVDMSGSTFSKMEPDGCSHTCPPGYEYRGCYKGHTQCRNMKI